MSKVDVEAAKDIAQALGHWNKNLNIQSSAEGDSIIATAKTIDVTAGDLRELADIIEADDATISFGRSGANFRMIIW